MIATVDWSAQATPSPKRPTADAIWIGLARGAEIAPPIYCRTRAEALQRLEDLLRAERDAGRRALAVFDFPFGYPEGFAEAVTGRPEALALWEWLADAVEDAPDNANNRFAVAERLNALTPGGGPFWGRPATANHPGVPEKKPRDAALPELRRVERRASGAQPCWKLYTTGSVGSQALLGIAGLARLRRRLAGGVAVWPFETGLAACDAPVVLAETYYALIDGAAAQARAADEPKDSAQVRTAAAAFARLDASGRLAALFGAAAELDEAERAVVAREEAWIFGVGHEDALRAAAAEAVGAARPAPEAPPMRDDCFALPPGVHWTPVAEALAHLRGAMRRVVDPETLPLAQADGRFLAEAPRARRAHPPAPNSAVDGYALAHAALGDAPEARLKLMAGRSAAGAPYDGAVPPGTALRILTGALIPKGADCVAMDEDVGLGDGEIALRRGLKAGANIRPAGENLALGAPAAPTGRRLGPADLAQIAAGGVGEVRAWRRLRVGVLSTGDELADPGVDAAIGAVFDSNRPMLLALLARLGFAPVDLGAAPDDAEAVRAALGAGAAACDALLTSGGASAGDEDHMSRLLRESGALSVWRIAMKPGRPLAMGVWSGKPVFGLPGNPVAAFVCALIFARPALSVMAGGDWPEPRPLLLPAAFAKRKKAGRTEYLRARLNDAGAVEVFHSEGSGLIGGLSWSDGLVELGDLAVEIAPGDPVAFLPYAAFGL
ncbi:MAG: molybdopterin-binding protein [Rubrimonas sp.]